MALSTPREPLDFGGKTRPPYPEWVLTIDPAAKPLVSAFNDAKATASTARTAAQAATRAFRDASVIDAHGDRIPTRSIDTDDWRILRYEEGDANTAADLADKAVRRAWRELSDIATSATVNAEVERVAHERHAALLAKFDELDAVLADFIEVDALRPDLFAPGTGGIRRAIGEDLKRSAAELRGIVAPLKAIPTRYTPEAREVLGLPALPTEEAAK